MKIKEIRSYKRNMGLTRPYTVAYQTFSEVVNAFIEIELTNGVVGMGAAAEGAYVTGETMEKTVSNLQSEYIQKWIGKDIRHFRSWIADSKRLFPLHPATQAAIDIALHDAFCKYLGVPVVDFYGRKHYSLPTSVTIGIGNIEATLEDARAYKAKGFRILKIKTGRDLEQDIERCMKLREEFGDYFSIRVDANQGYDFDRTLKFYKATKDLGLELIEQPLPAGFESDMKRLPEDLRKIIACDESLKNAGSAFQLASDPMACGVFNIKLMKCGGLLSALDIANIAHAAGIDLFWGCFDESIISISAALHVAFSCPGTKYLDLDGSLDLSKDVVSGGFRISDGKMSIVDGPGFGFIPLENQE
jgi:L-alanine-DL-glutamate epimerase-like enolase superfamily enzyme